MEMDNAFDVAIPFVYDLNFQMSNTQPHWRRFFSLLAG